MRARTFVGLLACAEALVAIGAAVGCGSEHALVGGLCRSGYVLVDDDCVAESVEPARSEDAAPSSDPPRAVLDASTPAPIPDASSDAADAVVADAALLPTPVLPRFDAGLLCGSSEVACRGTCISVDADGANCGACGKVCPSNICVAGECVGETPGDVVLLGHDFADAREGTAHARLLVNALTIPATDPIRILTWEDGAPAGSADRVRALATSSIRGRGVVFERGDATALASPSLASRYDVVLVLDGVGGDPVARGAAWSGSLARFAEKGGVLVVLDGAHGDVPSFVSATGLLAVGGHVAMPDGAHLLVDAPADVVGSQVLSPYAASGTSVAFLGASVPGPDVTWVVRVQDDAGAAGAPVVLHRVVR